LNHDDHWQRMHYILGRIVVGLVLGLISFIAYSSQIFVIWPWYGREWTVELVTLLAPFKYVLLFVPWVSLTAI
jgi:palmitoyltransferase